MCAGPRSTELARRDAYGPLITPSSAGAEERWRSATSTAAAVSTPSSPTTDSARRRCAPITVGGGSLWTLADRTAQLPPVMTLPGSAVGAGGALTVGVKELGPPGDTAFSVGDGAGALVVVVGVVLSGALFLSLPQAVSVPMPTIASPPAKSAICRVKRPDIMMSPYFSCRDY
ncbi:hypothetical protein MHPYR_140088 [uncultured Mycobacterium sp.]|uniref:Uncharacterized protein n=1 Tax=uncultured Mycobacterium sp. TaxID=171292 RepID=A0A1Y5P1T1_9MYCO|nr:hypothetical protein MHPYR_140088 [uncultured Mycobacterium sp.]